MAKANSQDKPAISNRNVIHHEIQLLMAIGDIETRMAVDPQHQRFAQLADVYLQAGEVDEAIRICEEGATHHPHYRTAMLILAKAYRQKGDRKKAIEVLRDYLNYMPASPAAHKMMGDLALEEHNLRAAFKHFRLALRLDPIHRPLVQQFVEVRDEFHKVKESLPHGEDDFDIEKPVIRKAEKESIRREKTIERVLDEVLDTPFKFPEKPLSEKEKAELLKEESYTPLAEMPDTSEAVLSTKSNLVIEPENKTDTIEFPKEPETPVITRETQDLLPDDEAISLEPSKISAAHFADLKPAYVDDQGILYFYEDDEVSFDQYKKRFELQKIGKARIINHALLDDLIARKKSAEPKVEPSTPKAEPPPKKPEPVTETAKPIEKTEAPVEEIQDFTPEIRQEQPVVLEEEKALEDVEMSYRDYLDILTEEEDLIEALMGEGERLKEPPTEEIATDLVSRIVADTKIEEVMPEEERPMAYTEYLASLTDPEDRREAAILIAPDEEKEDERLISLAEFARDLEEQDELLDFESYLILEPEMSTNELFAETEETEVEEERPISYYEYMKSLERDEDIGEAVLETAPAEMLEEIQEEESLMTAPEIMPIPKTEQEDKVEMIEAATEPYQKEKAEENLTQIQEPVVAVPETPKAETRQIPKAVEEKESVGVESATEAEEEAEEEFEIEEEIDPRKASLELVDQLARYGQFGAAYKVCKMLKLKNPTDAKVDRKILELKRLYLWSSQLVG